MDRKQLMEQLESMKKEFARKQRKLKKANKAVRVRAHVKQKIHELSLHAGTEKVVLSHITSSNVDEQQIIKSPVALLAKGSLFGEVFPYVKDYAGMTESLEGPGSNAINENVALNVALSNQDRNLVDQSVAVEQANHEKIKDASSEIIDSLAVTPTFKSIRDADSGFTGNVLQDGYGDLNSNMFSLRNHISSNLSGQETYQDILLHAGISSSFSVDSARLTESVFDNNVLSAGIHFDVGTETPCQQTEMSTRRTETLTKKSEIPCQTPPQKTRKSGTRTEAPTRWTSAPNKGSKTATTEIEKLGLVIKVSGENSLKQTECSATTAVNEKHTLTLANETGNKTVSDEGKCLNMLKLQDIGNDDQQSSSQVNPLQLSPRSEDQLLEYTELDVIPFSQFELTEDFLSETSHSLSSDSLGKGRKRISSGLVQRKSPRLSSVYLNIRDRFTRDGLPSYNQSRSQQRNIFRMNVKQKKSKKALLLSSLFQYLIDEAKRDISFVEFKLPEDIINLVKCSENQFSEEELSTDSKANSNIENCVAEENIANIPETELDPDFARHIFCDADSNLKSTENHGEERLISKFEQNSEQAILKTELLQYNQGPVENQSDLHVPAKHYGIEHLPQFTGGSDLSNSVCSCKNETLQKKSDNFSGVTLKTSTPDPRTTTDKLNTVNIRPLKLTDKSCTLNKRILKLKKKSLQNGSTGTEKTSAASYERQVTDSRSTILLTSESPGAEERANSVINGKVNLPVVELPATLERLQQPISTDISSPVLFGTQSQSSRWMESSKMSQVFQVSKKDPNQADSRPSVKEDSGDPVSDLQCSDPHTVDDLSWIRYVGCLQSGYKDAVVDNIVGVATRDGEDTAFILSVQTTALTLWTLDDQQKWSSEFHWYLPENRTVHGVCRLQSTDDYLTILVWGAEQDLPFLTMLVYQWHMQHIQRFSLPLPSPVIPERIFCVGLMSTLDTVIVFCSDKAYTRGKKYNIDCDQGCVKVEKALEETSYKLVDVCLVDQLPDAVIGLSADQRILIWNQKSGDLIWTFCLVAGLPTFSRLFFCCFFQGYLLLHMWETENRKDVCLVAINPVGGRGKVVRRFALPAGNHCDCIQVIVHQNLLLSLAHEGTLNIWNASTTDLLLSLVSAPGKIRTAGMLCVRDICWLLTGQQNGCVHLYSVTH